MSYLVDTDVLIDVLSGDAETLALMDRLLESGLSVSTITYMEIYQGILAGTSQDDAETRLSALLDGMPIIPILTGVARRCAQVRLDLHKRGKRIRPRALDLLTAACAIEFGLMLVTHNISDFDDIPGLSLYQQV